jgi:hypothetical protein
MRRYMIKCEPYVLWFECEVTHSPANDSHVEDEVPGSWSYQEVIGSFPTPERLQLFQ